MQDKTYLQAFYEKIAGIDEECKEAVEEIARMDFLMVLLQMIEERARLNSAASP